MADVDRKRPAVPRHPPPVEDDVPAALRRAIYYVLRVGVGAAVLLLLVGLTLLLSGPADVFGAAALTGSRFSLEGLASGTTAARGTALLLLGFLVLILTPLVRVVISAVAFGIARDRAFTVLTVTVLVLLGVSVLLGSYP